MFEIIQADSGVIGYVDEPHYIKVKPSSGAFVPATEADAEGVAFLGKPYNLSNRPPMKEGLRTVIINEKDGGEILLYEIDEVEAETGDALCELDAGLEDVKDALCELDAILEG